MLKNVLSAVIAVVLMSLIFVGCEKTKTTDDEHTHTHEWLEATCESPKKCAVCDATEGDALPHEYTNGTCTVCGTDNPELLADYTQAQELIKSGKYEEAYKKLKELGDFKDVKILLSRFHYALVTSRGSGSYSKDISITYDENNLPKQKTTINSDGSKTYVDFTYDEKGYLISTVHTNTNGTRDYYDFVYDSNGRVIKEVLEDESYVKNYYYGTNGRVSRIFVDYSSGSDNTYEYTYDSSGNLIKESYTNIFGKTIHDYTYDKNGKLIKTVSTYSTENKDITEYTYDASGKLIKEFTTKYTNATYTYTYEYDANGNLIKETYQSIGSPIITKYTYKLVYIPYDIDDLSNNTKYLLEDYGIVLNSVN